MIVSSQKSVLDEAVLSKRTRRLWILTILALCYSLGSGVAGSVAYYRASRKPDPKKDRKAAVKFLASEHFKKLPMQEKRVFIRDLGGPRAMRSVPPQVRHAAFENMRSVREAEMDARMKKFFKLSKEEQNAQLDADIKRMEARRKEWEARRKAMEAQRAKNGNKGGGPGGRGPRQAPNASMMRSFEASHNPSAGARRQVYMTLLRQRQQSKK